MVWVTLQQASNFSSVSYGHNKSTCLNSSYIWIARPSGLLSTPPASRPIFHDSLRKWEKAAKNPVTFVIRQQGLTGLTHLQDTVQKNLNNIQDDQNKGQSSNKCQNATDELQYLIDFNQSISLAIARTMLHFYPTTLKGCRGIVFTHGVRMDGCREKFVRAVSQKL